MGGMSLASEYALPNRKQRIRRGSRHAGRGRKQALSQQINQHNGAAFTSMNPRWIPVMVCPNTAMIAA